MPKTHTHHPDGAGPVCRFTTKKECDTFFQEWKKAGKRDYEEQKELELTQIKTDRIERFDAFIASEKARQEALVS